jgi:phosphate transport system permease protein
MENLKKQLISPDMADRLFKIITAVCALLAVAITSGFFVQLFWSSIPAIKTFGFDFLISSEWDPVKNLYGAMPAIAGTLATTAIAVIIAVPLSFIVAMFLVETAPPALSHALSHAIDLLAAIPSIIYGMWGLFIFVPFMQNHAQPFLADTLHLSAIPLFAGEYNGFGFLTSGIILAVMILPFICAIMRDVFRMAPPALKESAFGAGATPWEVTVDITMRYGARGLLGAIFLGLGRAVGETMAVLFVIGNVQKMPASLYQAGATISTTLANNFAEAQGVFRSALFELGLILLAISFLIQALAQFWLDRVSRKMGEK